MKEINVSCEIRIELRLGLHRLRNYHGAKQMRALDDFFHELLPIRRGNDGTQRGVQFHISRFDFFEQIGKPINGGHIVERDGKPLTSAILGDGSQFRNIVTIIAQRHIEHDRARR